MPCRELGIRPGKALVSRFSDGEVQVEIEENVRRQEVFIIQPTNAPTAENFMELLVLVDALKARLGGQRDRSGAVFRLRPPGSSPALVAGADHRQGRGQDVRRGGHRPGADGGPARRPDQGFSTSRWTTCTPRRCCWRTSGAHGADNLIVVSPDVGGVVRARAIAKRLDDADLAIIDKRRPKANVATVMNIIGDVEARPACWSTTSSIPPAPCAPPPMR